MGSAGSFNLGSGPRASCASLQKQIQVWAGGSPTTDRASWEDEAEPKYQAWLALDMAEVRHECTELWHIANGWTNGWTGEPPGRSTSVCQPGPGPFQVCPALSPHVPPPHTPKQALAELVTTPPPAPTSWHCLASSAQSQPPTRAPRHGGAHRGEKVQGPHTAGHSPVGGSGALTLHPGKLPTPRHPLLHQHTWSLTFLCDTPTVLLAQDTDPPSLRKPPPQTCFTSAVTGQVAAFSSKQESRGGGRRGRAARWGGTTLGLH